MFVFRWKKRCPICGGKMRKANVYLDDLNCKNNCCEVMVNGGKVVGITFWFDFENNEPCFYNVSLPKKLEESKERIKYWKENDRYLVHIMTK